MLPNLFKRNKKIIGAIPQTTLNIPMPAITQNNKSLLYAADKKLIKKYVNDARSLVNSGNVIQALELLDIASSLCED